MSMLRVMLSIVLIGAAPVSLITFPDAVPVSARELAIRLAPQADAARLARGEIAAPPLLVDPAKEQFQLNIPKAMPPEGYGLFVYISPSDSADLPAGWRAAVESAGMIAISAARSGNDQPAFPRRMPLALMAAQGAMKHYRIDPNQIIVAGFSGGSRVAMRLALAYPEVFKGALLDAGSDVVGTIDVPLPAPERLEVVHHNRFAFVSGGNDSAAAIDARAASALRALGIPHLMLRRLEGLGHSPMPAADLRVALRFLVKNEAASPRANATKGETVQ